jgi:hypothetical protein
MSTINRREYTHDTQAHNSRNMLLRTAHHKCAATYLKHKKRDSWVVEPAHCSTALLLLSVARTGADTTLACGSAMQSSTTGHHHTICPQRQPRCHTKHCMVQEAAANLPKLPCNSRCMQPVPSLTPCSWLRHAQHNCNLRLHLLRLRLHLLLLLLLLRPYLAWSCTSALPGSTGTLQTSPARYLQGKCYNSKHQNNPRQHCWHVCSTNLRTRWQQG